MALFLYKCNECEVITEKLQLNSRGAVERPVRCSECGSEMVKILSPPGLQFKGDGFYITDYKSVAKDYSVDVTQ